MGAGIAQLALEAGHEVVLSDVDTAAIDRATDRIRDGLGRRAARLELDPESIDDWIDGRILGLRGTDVLEQLADEADVVIEAALEQLELKQTIFRALDGIEGGPSILATNTSALSIAAIAAATDASGAGRRAPLLQSRAGDAARRGRRRAGDRAERRRVGERPRRIVGPDRRALCGPAGLHRQPRQPSVHDRGAADPRGGAAGVEAIDGAIRGAGYPLGPFELMDLTGHRRDDCGRDRDLGGARAAGPAPAVADPGGARRRGSSRPEDGRGVLPIRRTAGSSAGAAVRGGAADGRRLAGRRASATGSSARSIDEARLAVDEGVASAGRRRSRPPAGRRPSGRAVRAGRTSTGGEAGFRADRPAMLTRADELETGPGLACAGASPALAGTTRRIAFGGGTSMVRTSRSGAPALSCSSFACGGCSGGGEPRRREQRGGGAASAAAPSVAAPSAPRQSTGDAPRAEPRSPASRCRAMPRTSRPSCLDKLCGRRRSRRAITGEHVRAVRRRTRFVDVAHGHRQDRRTT